MPWLVENRHGHRHRRLGRAPAARMRDRQLGLMARSVMIVARPAAIARSHDADVSPLVGQRRQAQMSAAARCAGSSASGTKPVTCTRAAMPWAAASAGTS